MTFFGHEDKVTLFTELAKQDMLRNAYLFFGDVQIGKFRFAQHLAYFLEYGEFSLGERPLLDTVYVEPKEEAETIGIDDLRAVRRFLFQKPFRSKRRLVVVNDAHRLTPHAQSSVLKFVEDSPSHTTFIFIAWDPQVLLPPLASRLLKVYFTRFSKEEVADILQKHYKLKKEEAERTAIRSFGRIGCALELLAVSERQVSRLAQRESEQAPEEQEPFLAEEVSDTIVELYLKDKKKNAVVLSWLLKKQGELIRYNLNPNLQRKAIEKALHQMV